MDLNIIIGWSITILAITVLIIYLKVRSKKKDEKTLEPLLSFASEHNSEISYYNTWENTLIGIDNNEANRLFFIRKTPGGEIRKTINLSEVTDCRMVKIERKVKYNKEIVNVIDRIEVILSFSKHKPEISLEFYNDDYDQLTLSGELQFAQKWTSMLKGSVKTKPDRSYKRKEFVNPLIVKPEFNKIELLKNRKIRRPVEMEHAV